ncbi:MAG TPA: transglutaminase domain-containing protein [Phycisphaerae bacterium]|nr:transglutaminase domain-containing protein [Phycisphaerae bacterium]HRW54715.1 transglutaminase domain-containing protein [Phycisphaerae bacterium]
MDTTTLLFVLLATAPMTSDRTGEETGVRYEVAYHHVLRNRSRDTLRDVRVYLTVPSNDDYQTIEGFRVEAFGRPVHISNRHDEYGNTLKRVAIPEIKPGEEARVGFTCEVTLRTPKQADVSGASKGSYDDVDPDLIAHYTRDHRIFGLQTPIIRETADRLLKGHPDPTERAVAIHHLIADTFKYQGGDGWDTAPVVLERRSGSCSEFSHVFCALCRATGIPTRMAGSSIVPAKRRLPFVDRGWHRWPEAYLPGQGWVSFDPTLDRGRKKPLFVGTHHGRTLIVTRKGDRSTQLGLSYISSNSHDGPLKRSRYFVWTQGTMERLEKAKEMIASGDKRKARKRLERLVDGYGDTRAGIEAAALLRTLEKDND